MYSHLFLENKQGGGKKQTRRWKKANHPAGHQVKTLSFDYLPGGVANKGTPPEMTKQELLTGEGGGVGGVLFQEMIREDTEVHNRENAMTIFFD